MGYYPFFFDEELFLAWGAGEPDLGAEGEGDHIMVFGLRVFNHLEGHGNVPVLASVVARGFPRGAHGQDSGLVQRYVTERLTLASEVEFFFFLLAFVLGHGEL